jgi:diketogulonate reductase-like aldo/keto reductase
MVKGISAIFYPWDPEPGTAGPFRITPLHDLLTGQAMDKPLYSRRTFTRCLLQASAGCLLLPGTWPALPLTLSQKMLTRPIPATGELLPALGLGTWQTFDVGPAPQDREPLQQVLRLFADMGGTLIDSSPMYGRSEEVTGDLSVALGLEKKLFLATKVWTRGEQAGLRQMEDSIREMRRPVLDLMQIHNLVDWQVHLKTLRRWKAEQRIRYIGLTHYTVSAYPELERLLRTEAVDFVQLNYNIGTRDAARRLLPLAADKGVAVIVNRPFESGTLFSAVKNKPLPAWAADFDCQSWGQFFLKYILGHPAITCVIPATAKVHHLRDNMTAGYGRLPDAATRKKMETYLQSIL